MTRLLSLFLLLGCLDCFGQFGVEQPFFLQSSAGPWTPASAPGLRNWWVASDLPLGAVNTWTDRVSGVILTNGSGVGITNTASGLWWAGTQYMTSAVPLLESNWCMAFIVKPYMDWLGITHAPGLFSDKNGSTFMLAGTSETTWTFYVAIYGDLDPYEVGDWHNVVMENSNNVALHLYTNGVRSAKSRPGLGWELSRVGSGPPEDMYFYGWFAELALYTNVNNWSAQGASFNTYATNTYPLRAALDPPVAFVTNTTVGTLRNNYTGRVGFKLDLWVPITVTHLGRWIVAGNSGTHTLYLKDSGGSTLGSVDLITANYSVGAYAYTNLASPVRLTSHTVYYVESAETNTGDQWYDLDTVVVGDAFIGKVECHASNEGGGATPNRTYGPVNFKYQ